MRAWERRGRGGAPASTQQLCQVFFNATRDAKSGIIYLKVVNTSETAQRINVRTSGAKSISSRGEAVVLAANKLDDTNFITEPNTLVPHAEKAGGLSANFTREFPACSVTVMKLKTK